MRVERGARLHGGSLPACAAARGESAADVVRSALCVEPRGGVLYIFMPPVEALEDYLDLVARRRGDRRARSACACCSKAIRRRAIRGCRIFSSRRIPGVIEVNVQPAAQLGSARRADDRRSTRMRGSAASLPRSSCSTAATPAPAAAIISCWAARRRPTARFSAVPTCCAA